MATVNPTLLEVAPFDGSCTLVTWVLTTADADGAPVSLPQNADCTMHAWGTWGGATLTAQGSNERTSPANYVPLSNAAGGTAATFTANAIRTLIERPLIIRPNLTTPGSGASVTVQMLMRRSNPMRT